MREGDDYWNVLADMMDRVDQCHWASGRAENQIRWALSEARVALLDVASEAYKADGGRRLRYGDPGRLKFSSITGTEAIGTKIVDVEWAISERSQKACDKALLRCKRINFRLEAALAYRNRFAGYWCRIAGGDRFRREDLEWVRAALGRGMPRTVRAEMGNAARAALESGNEPFGPAFVRALQDFWMAKARGQDIRVQPILQTFGRYPLP